MHTWTKLGIAFWDYLGDRLHTIRHPKVPHSRSYPLPGTASLNPAARGFAPLTWPERPSWHPVRPSNTG